jgi:hypothetical protein
MNPTHAPNTGGTPSRLLLLALLSLTVLPGCESEAPGAPDAGPTQASAARPGHGGPEPLAAAADGPGTLSTTLPFAGSVSSSGTAWDITNTGAGPAGSFVQSNPDPTLFSFGVYTQVDGGGWALYALSRGSGRALHAANSGTGGAAQFETNSTNGSNQTVNIFTNGLGSGLSINNGNSSNAGNALSVDHFGSGILLRATAQGTGPAGQVMITNALNTNPALAVSTAGTGTSLLVDQNGTAGALAIFRRAGVNQARISRTGRGFFNGGTQTGGADIAEAFEVEGRPASYEPGDVLAVSTLSDRRVVKSDSGYSTRIIGVYATRPGVLLTERSIDDSLDDMVPVGVVGVIPTKVTAENGAIRRGDLLVSAATPGHAMRADAERLGFGMVLGKALEEFAGPGRGVIRVLVNVR